MYTYFLFILERAYIHPGWFDLYDGLHGNISRDNELFHDPKQAHVTFIFASFVLYVQQMQQQPLLIIVDQVPSFRSANPSPVYLDMTLSLLRTLAAVYNLYFTPEMLVSAINETVLNDIRCYRVSFVKNYKRGGDANFFDIFKRFYDTGTYPIYIYIYI